MAIDHTLSGDAYWNQFPAEPSTISAPGTPWGTQAGSQDTGIAGPASGTLQYAPSGIASNDPPMSAAAPTGGGGGGGKDAFGQAWLASGGRTVQDLKNFVAAHPEYGVKLGGSKGDKVYGPDGSYWADAVMSAGTGGTGALWDTSTGGGSGQGNTLAGLGYGFGSSMAPWTQSFNAPTADQALNSPGLQFALSEANRMGQNSAAAKGTLLNGRFQQALNASNIGNALQGYGDVYNRSMGEYMLNRDNFFQNQDRPFDKNLSLAKLGAPQ